jgi:GNAT superfamily N-acetyltransferase
MPPAVTVRDATSPGDIAVARGLFQEYADRLGVDLCFQGFAAELAGLPGDYAPPAGRLLLAECDGGPVGCVALRRISDTIGEMKRLYVRPAVRGRGVGRELVHRVIAAARAAGYRQLYLDTLPQMGEAIRLYESLGFRDVPPYRQNPVPGARYLGLNLAEKSP